jgi:hypothetical protein
MAVKDSVFEKLKKTSLMLGSDRPPERHNACDLIYKMCEQNDISVAEGLSGAFGSGDDEEIQQLRGQLEEAQSTKVELLETLRSANVELNGLRGVPSAAIRVMLRRIWARPQACLSAAFLLVAWRFWLGSEVTPYIVGHDRLLIAFAAVNWLLTGYFFRCWAKTEFVKHNEGVVVLKIVVIAFCLFEAMASYKGTGYVLDWTNNSTDLTPAWVWTTLGWLGSATNLCSWIAHQLAHSQAAFFKMLRNVFV